MKRPRECWLCDPNSQFLDPDQLAVGLLNLGGGYLLYREHGKAWLLPLFALASTGAIGTGLFPFDTGDAHSLFALVSFLCFTLEAVGTATLLRGAMRVISVLAGVDGLVFLVLMTVGDAGHTAAFGPIGHDSTARLFTFGDPLLGASPTPGGE